MLLAIVVLLVVLLLLVAFCMKYRMKGGTSLIDLDADLKEIRERIDPKAKGEKEILTNEVDRNKINAFIEFCYPAAKDVDFIFVVDN